MSEKVANANSPKTISLTYEKLYFHRCSVGEFLHDLINVLGLALSLSL